VRWVGAGIFTPKKLSSPKICSQPLPALALCVEGACTDRPTHPAAVLINDGPVAVDLEHVIAGDRRTVAAVGWAGRAVSA
jgi:hypothetical protein